MYPQENGVQDETTRILTTTLGTAVGILETPVMRSGPFSKKDQIWNPNHFFPLDMNVFEKEKEKEMNRDDGREGAKYKREERSPDQVVSQSLSSISPEMNISNSSDFVEVPELQSFGQGLSDQSFVSQSPLFPVHT